MFLIDHPGRLAARALLLGLVLLPAVTSAAGGPPAVRIPTLPSDRPLPDDVQVTAAELSYATGGEVSLTLRFAATCEPSRRRWLCEAGDAGGTVCRTHLAVPRCSREGRAELRFPEGSLRADEPRRVVEARTPDGTHLPVARLERFAGPLFHVHPLPGTRVELDEEGATLVLEPAARGSRDAGRRRRFQALHATP